MSYGDSANWDGVVPSASDATYTIEWRIRFKGKPPLECRFDVSTGEDLKDVAIRHKDRWNDQNPQGRRAVYSANRPYSVQFDGEVTKMMVRGYILPPPGTLPPFVDVQYGVKTPVLANSAGDVLSVFNA